MSFDKVNLWLITCFRWWLQGGIFSRYTVWRKMVSWSAWTCAWDANPRWTSAAQTSCGIRWRRTCWPPPPPMEPWWHGTWRARAVTNRNNCSQNTSARSTRSAFTLPRSTCCCPALRTGSWSVLTCERRRVWARFLVRTNVSRWASLTFLRHRHKSEHLPLGQCKKVSFKSNNSPRKWLYEAIRAAIWEANLQLLRD